MSYCEIGDLSFYYEVHGSGPRVLWISGSGGDLRANPARGKGPLEQRFQVLMFDQRGLGQTSKPDRPYTMEDYADDAAALMDSLGWERAHVLGISFGGMVAQHLALRHPERVDKLVLACTSSGGEGGASFDLRALAAMDPEERFRTRLELLDTRNRPTADPPVYAPRFERIAERMAAPALNAHDPHAEMGARRQIEARAGHDTWDRLHHIDAPTLVIGGRYDQQAPPENLERLTAALPNARLAFFDGGHLFFLQDPASWTEVIQFLEE